MTVHHLSHPFETQSDLSLWFHTTPKGDVITGTRGKPEHSICDEALDFHFQGSQKYSESYFLKCDLWRIGVGRCLINGSLQTVAWSGKAVTTNSHSSGLLLSERFILTIYHVFFLKCKVKKGTQWLEILGFSLGGSEHSLPWSGLPSHFSGTKRMGLLWGGSLEEAGGGRVLIYMVFSVSHAYLFSLESSLWFFLHSLYVHRYSLNPVLVRYLRL